MDARRTRAARQFKKWCEPSGKIQFTDMEYIIHPLTGVNQFSFGESRSRLSSMSGIKATKTFEESSGSNKFIVDDYADFLAYYNREDSRLFYMTFVPLPTVTLLLDGKDLFSMRSREIYEYLSAYDPNLFVEDYVGFGSTLLGIDVYSPGFTDDADARCEGISVAVKGYFDAVYKGTDFK